jgi:PEP-CTERM motif
MLRKPSPQQTAFEMVSLEGLVPKDHLLRKIDAVIDFSFIHDRVAGLSCPDNGRPPALTSASVTVGQWTDYTYTFSAPKSGDFALDFNFISGTTPAKDVLLDAVAISPVPEPAIWAMLLIGFAGLGFLAYRRNKAPALHHA